LDPLDLEILHRAFDATQAVASDEGLEAILRRELVEIACFNGVSDLENPSRPRPG